MTRKLAPVKGWKCYKFIGLNSQDLERRMVGGIKLVSNSVVLSNLVDITATILLLR